MSTIESVTLPDVGDFDSIDVIEVLVTPGESVEAEQSLIVLESDKATMEIPSPKAGVVETDLDALIQLACRLGASEAAVIPASEISVEDDLAKFCQEPQCEN